MTLNVPHLIINRGDSDSNVAGVPGNRVAGEPALEHSNECECDNGGV